MEEKPKTTYKDVEAAFSRGLLLADKEIIRLLAASVLANQLEGPPVWMMVVGNSSGGKSALLMTLDELELIPGKRMTFFISDLTENTLASGFKSGQNESSLLLQMPLGGMFIFKDFTSLLTKRRESRDAIMGQLREVYDRKFDKRTGNSQNITWKGKVGALAGVTQAVYEYISEMSIMGDRFIMYQMNMPDRLAATRFVMDLKMKDNSQERHIDDAKKVFHTYLRETLKGMNKAKLYIDPADQDTLIRVADFATKVRSGVVEDDRTGRIKFVPSPEMPMRLIDQLLSLGTALCHMHVVEGEDPKLSERDLKLLYKIAFDSIPIKRRWALVTLAEHPNGVTTAGLAAKIGYETEVVKGWLAQLNALHIARRLKSAGQGDTWMLETDLSDIVSIFTSFNVTQDVLVDPDAAEDDRLADEALAYEFDEPEGYTPNETTP